MSGAEVMKEKNVYYRKISAKESKENFIFILKDQLSFFPPIGNKFELNHDDISKLVKVESYPCTCRGPDYPHEHYFIRWSNLSQKDEIKIIKTPENENKYNLQIKKP